MLWNYKINLRNTGGELPKLLNDARQGRNEDAFVK